jgi:hypothetical protein
MFKFNFGKKKVDKKTAIIITAVISTIIATLSQCTGVSQKTLWDLLDEAQRTLFPQTIINDVLKENPEVLDRRIKRDVDRAIRDYEDLTKDSEPSRIPLPRLIERAPDEALCYSDECKALGGEMRLCAPWLDTCPKQ